MTTAWLTEVRERVRDVPDFPKPGIVFKDITPVLADGAMFRGVIRALSERVARHRPEKIVAIESRGFIFGAAVAAELGVGFVPVRKPGKLPAATERASYDLEYGTDAVEIHRDAVEAGVRVALIDDVIATGGTAKATVALVERLGATVVTAAFFIELTFLGGAARLAPCPTEALLQY